MPFPPLWWRDAIGTDATSHLSVDGADVRNLVGESGLTWWQSDTADDFRGLPGPGTWPGPGNPLKLAMCHSCREAVGSVGLARVTSGEDLVVVRNFHNLDLNDQV